MADINSRNAEIEAQGSAAITEIEAQGSAAMAEQTQDTAAIDSKNSNDMLVSDITGILESVKSTPLLRHCIYRVPIEVRENNESAYTPRVVSIGPFHYDSKTLKSMENNKLYYVNKLFERGNKRADDCVPLLRELEGAIRHCYADTISLESDEFLKMILVDAGFIIELLMRFNFGVSGEKDPNEPLLPNGLDHDLLLLENQLPFFVLQELFKNIFAPFPNNLPSLVQLTLVFFKNYYKQDMFPADVEVRHFTDLIRTLHLPMSRRLLPQRALEEFKSLHSATELHEAGVKFKVGSRKCLLDIHFSNGVLEIPCFELSDQTTPFIQNLMALERCHYSHDNYIIDYIVLMAYLIKAPKDVDLLVKKKILLNGLGSSDAAATFFNDLFTQVRVNCSNFYYSRLCKDLNAYKKVPLEFWMAIFKHDYCSTPWRAASTTAAVILLVLTFIQAICSLVSVKRV